MNLPVTFKEIPFFKLLIPLLFGIVCQHWLVFLNGAWWCYVISLLVLSALLVSYYFSSRWQYRWVFGAVLNVSIFFFGAFLTLQMPITDKIEVNASNKTIIQLLDNPQIREKSIRVEAKIKSAYSKGIWWATNEKILVYYELIDTMAVRLKYGALLAVDLSPREVAQLGNPEQFDFKRYLSNRGIRLTAHVKKNQWVVIGYEGSAIKRTALYLRDKLVAMFKQYGLSGNELAVASALTLGYQDLLDDELRQVYSSSGAMHILSVSGLHVGVLYVLLSFLLSFLDKKKLTRALKALILLSFLWFFALITGLPPCVQRSALMFSFLVVGDFFSRKSNIYNTLSASAFVLLVINPYNLFDVGFQLSYLAVISIVFFYPYVYRIIYLKNWALDKIWSLIAVSIAAQVGTFSLSLFYFNQFPNYFLLSNLVAIPLSTIALYLAVLLIIVSPIHWLSVYVGKALSISISWLNHGLELVEKLPYSVSGGLTISSFQMLLLFLFAITLAFFLASKRGRFALIGLSFLAIFLIDSLILKVERSSVKEFIVFNIGKKSLVSFRVGEKLTFVDVDTSKVDFGEKYDFFVKGYVTKVNSNCKFDVINPFNKSVQAKPKYLYPLDYKGVSVMSFNNRIFVIPYDKNLSKFEAKRKMDVDYLLITKYFPAKGFSFFNPKLVIIDSSVSKQKAIEFTLKCREIGIPCYVVTAQGAFIKAFG